MALNITLNANTYNVPTELGDITLGRHIALMAVESDAPKQLQEIMAEADEKKRSDIAAKIRPTTYAKKLLPYFAKYVSAATDIPVNVLLGDKDNEGAPIGLIEHWYWMIQTAYTKNPGPQDKRVFEINGEVWTLPNTHMTGATFGEFAEAAQYEEFASQEREGAAWEQYPYMIAVLLRPEGEKFDPYAFDLVLESRAQIMRGLPMTDVQAIAFFLLRRNESLGSGLKIYLLAQTLSWLRREQAK